jgi:hypothetical protein
MRLKLAIMVCATLILGACGQGKAPEGAGPAAAPVAAASAEPAASAAGDPVAVIEPLYKPYLTDGRTPPLDWSAAVPWTKATRALIEKEAAMTAKTGEVGAIDGDVIVAAQDWKLSDLKVTAKSPPADGKAVVEATFDNLGKKVAVDWDMVVEDGVWKVADVHEPSVDLVKLLTETTLGTNH